MSSDDELLSQSFATSSRVPLVTAIRRRKAFTKPSIKSPTDATNQSSDNSPATKTNQQKQSKPILQSHQSAKVRPNSKSPQIKLTDSITTKHHVSTGQTTSESVEESSPSPQTNEDLLAQRSISQPLNQQRHFQEPPRSASIVNQNSASVDQSINQSDQSTNQSDQSINQPFDQANAAFRYWTVDWVQIAALDSVKELVSNGGHSPVIFSASAPDRDPQWDSIAAIFSKWESDEHSVPTLLNGIHMYGSKFASAFKKLLIRIRNSYIAKNEFMKRAVNERCDELGHDENEAVEQMSRVLYLPSKGSDLCPVFALEEELSDDYVDCFDRAILVYEHFIPNPQKPIKKRPREEFIAYTDEDDPDYLHELALVKKLEQIDAAGRDISQEDGLVSRKRNNARKSQSSTQPSQTNTDRTNKLDAAIAALQSFSNQFYDYCDGDMHAWLTKMDVPALYHSRFAELSLIDVWDLTPAKLGPLLNGADAAPSRKKWREAMVLRFNRVDWR